MIKNRYQVLKKIGNGNFGEVFEAKDVQTSQHIALKALKKGVQQQPIIFNLVKLEVGILKRLNHRNIVRMIDSFEENGIFYLIYDLCKSGDLCELIQKQKRLSELEALKILKQIVEGLTYLRSQRVIHRDIKPENIFMNGELAKIGDFGLCNEGVNIKDTLAVGSIAFQAPEIHQYHEYSSKTDIYATGMTFHEMLFGDIPITDADVPKILEKKYNLRILSKPGYNISERSMLLLRRMIAPDQKKRIDLKTLKTEIDIILKDLNGTNNAFIGSPYQEKRNRNQGLIHGSLSPRKSGRVLIRRELPKRSKFLKEERIILPKSNYQVVKMNKNLILDSPRASLQAEIHSVGSNYQDSREQSPLLPRRQQANKSKFMQSISKFNPNRSSSTFIKTLPSSKYCQQIESPRNENTSINSSPFKLSVHKLSMRVNDNPSNKEADSGTNAQNVNHPSNNDNPIISNFTTHTNTVMSINNTVLNDPNTKYKPLNLGFNSNRILKNVNYQSNETSDKLMRKYTPRSSKNYSNKKSRMISRLKNESYQSNLIMNQQSFKTKITNKPNNRTETSDYLNSLAASKLIKEPVYNKIQNPDRILFSKNSATKIYDSPSNRIRFKGKSEQVANKTILRTDSPMIGHKLSVDKIHITQTFMKNNQKEDSNKDHVFSRKRAIESPAKNRNEVQNQDSIIQDQKNFSRTDGFKQQGFNLNLKALKKDYEEQYENQLSDRRSISNLRGSLRNKNSKTVIAWDQSPHNQNRIVKKRQARFSQTSSNHISQMQNRLGNLSNSPTKNSRRIDFSNINIIKNPISRNQMSSNTRGQQNSQKAGGYIDLEQKGYNILQMVPTMKIQEYKK